MLTSAFSTTIRFYYALRATLLSHFTVVVMLFFLHQYLWFVLHCVSKIDPFAAMQIKRILTVQLKTMTRK